MRHSNFETIRRAMHNTEEKEFIDAIKAHGGKYTFITEEQIREATENDVQWEEDVPHVNTYHFDDEDYVEVCVTGVNYTEYDGEAYVSLIGITYRDRDNVDFPYYSVIDGDLHYIMDFMSEPLGSDK